MCLNRFLTKRRLDMTTRDESKQRKKKKLRGGNFTFISDRTGADDGTKDIFNISPVETSIKFDLPTQSSLSDSVQSSPQFTSNINNFSLGNLQIFVK